ncbi:MAG TPA: ferritin [Bacteroidales bacterium]|nr:ferritin [Bacteroidales bacterium]HRZ47971.1 ferritin [Bacteroidales bacterium]
MLTKKMEAALNEQINAEFESAYLYLSMATWFEEKNLEGMANWMMIQFKEEQTHALKFYAYVVERGGRVTLKAIRGPQTEWKSVLDVFEETLKHEHLVTSLINNLVDLAIKEKDHATNNMLQWFVAEQVEEEANAERIISMMKLIGDNVQGLFMLDRELASRVFVDATQAAN